MSGKKWSNRQDNNLLCMGNESREKHTHTHTQWWSKRKEVAPLFFSLAFVSFLCNADLTCFARAKSKQNQVSMRDTHHGMTTKGGLHGLNESGLNQFVWACVFGCVSMCMPTQRSYLILCFRLSRFPAALCFTGF